MSSFETLKRTLEENIKRLDDESSRHKRLYRRCQTATILMTALTTIVAGAGLIVPEAYDKVVQFSVLCLTAVTAAIAAWSEMRRARELWQHEREVYYALIDIQREMEFKQENRGLKEVDLAELFGRVSAVLGSSSQKWARIQEKKLAPPAAASGVGEE